MEIFDHIREREEMFEEQGTRAELRLLNSTDHGLVSRSSYYDGGDRLILVDSRLVEESEVPEDERADRTEDDDRTGFDTYLRQEEVFYRVEQMPEDPLLGESRGWLSEESSDPVEVYMPVENGEVVRQAGNMPVPVFLVWDHYNQNDDVLTDGGLWDEIMGEDPEA